MTCVGACMACPKDKQRKRREIAKFQTRKVEDAAQDLSDQGSDHGIITCTNDNQMVNLLRG